jgi:autotransporter-associated beta strand protein
MKLRTKSIPRFSALCAIASLATLHAADITLGTGTYTDTQTYNNGTISGPVTFNSGANYTFDNLNLPLAWNRVILNSGATLNVGGNLSIDFSGVSLNGGTLTAGGLLLHDSPNWAGAINDGIQSIEQGDSIINGATLVANQSNANFISFIGSSSNPQWDVHLANNLWLGNDGATINSNGHNIGITMAMGNFSGQSGSLSKTGAGTLTLSANNSYSAGTTVNNGVLEVQGSSAGNGYIRGTVTVNSGAELRYTGGDGTGFGFNGGNRLDTININGGLVSSVGNMTHLWGASVNMTGGELRVNNGTSSPTGHRIEWFQSTVNTSASANTATISGRINLRGDGGGQIAVFNVPDGAAATDLQVSAAVTESFDSVGITKNGAGTMELTGSNSYTGATLVSGGKLIVNGNISTSVTTVQSGGTIGGSGTVGSLIVQAGGTVAPGNSPGILTVDGDYSQSGTLALEINGLSAGSLHDQVVVDRSSGDGTVSISGNLSLLFGGGYTPANGDLIFILLNDGSDTVSGTFSGLVQNDIVGSYGGFDWRISYTADGSGSSFLGGNDIALVAVPEPGAALLGGLGMLALLRRRR